MTYPRHLPQGLVERQSSRSRILARGAGYGSLVGVICGGALGAAIGQLIGCLFGAVVGLLVGLILGLVTAAVLAILYPHRSMTSKTQVRSVAAAISGAAAFVAAWMLSLDVWIVVVFASACSGIGATLAVRVSFDRPQRDT